MHSLVGDYLQRDVCHLPHTLMDLYREIALDICLIVVEIGTYIRIWTSLIKGVVTTSKAYASLYVAGELKSWDMII